MPQNDEIRHEAPVRLREACVGGTENQVEDSYNIEAERVRQFTGEREAILRGGVRRGDQEVTASAARSRRRRS